MAMIELTCPYCGCKKVTLNGKNRKTGRQRYLCHNTECSHRHFQLGYRNNAYWPGTKEKIVEMVMSGTGQRDTRRMLAISNVTVTSVLKEQNNS